jgi:hypothetical protein
MRKTVLKFGVWSGLVMAVLMVATVPFAHRIGFNNAMYVGYTTMVLAFLLVFFGVRSYRENECGGRISFGRALGVGLLIALVTCIFYVATWEVMYFGFMPHFMDDYGTHEIEQARASGASEAAIKAKQDALDKAKAMYKNPVYNAGMTFLEPLPVALVMALVSAGMLRRREAKTEGEAATAS